MKMDISNVIIGKRVFFRKCVCMMFVAAVIITYMFSVDCNIVKADEWDDAVKYYSNYGNAAVFKASASIHAKSFQYFNLFVAVSYLFLFSRKYIYVRNQV